MGNDYAIFGRVGSSLALAAIVGAASAFAIQPTGNPGSAGTPAGGFNCYAPDVGAASTNRAVHYNWASSRDTAALKAGLEAKLNRLFSCSIKSKGELDNDFADMSLVVARYVTNAACLRNDQGAVSTDRSVHYNWAARHDRAAVLEGARWKMLGALDCLDRSHGLDYYSDISVVMGRAGSR